MKNLQAVRSALEEYQRQQQGRKFLGYDGIAVTNCLSPDLRKWLVAQRDAYSKGNLNEMRVNYLDQLCKDYNLDLSNI